MKKTLNRWTIKRLREEFRAINFPEYQREPNVWDRSKKQRLIDSMLRGFDIATIYLYRNGEADLDCIDGRQRLNAIMSFVGENEDDPDGDNHFPFHGTNEVLPDENRFADLQGERYTDEAFQPYKKEFDAYVLNVVEISDVGEPEELNLLFLRLQLGSVLNSGEKLHAMTGDMRDFVFKELGPALFFRNVSIQYRRFAREQVAAQIACSLFAQRDEGKFARIRHLDLQVFFSKYKAFAAEDKRLSKEIMSTAIVANQALGTRANILKNRALTVSFFLYVDRLLLDKNKDQILAFVEFFETLLSRLGWQIPLGLSMDAEYHELSRLQTDVTQASVERIAVTRRHEFIHRYFTHYLGHKEILGDKQYTKRTGLRPGQTPR